MPNSVNLFELIEVVTIS